MVVGSIPIASIVINLLIVVLCVVGWLQIVFEGNNDSAKLSERGVVSLRYYTVLSNLFSAVVSVAYLVVGAGLSAALPTWLLTLKLAGAASVMVTFVVVVFYLAPNLGWKPLYEGGNFWLHGVLPLLALVDCCAFVPVGTLPISATFMAVSFTVAYGVWYIGMVLVHGRERDGRVYDIYRFFQWGYGKVPFVAGAVLLANWVLAWLIWLASGMLVTLP